MVKKIFENYEAFYCMLTSVTMLSNTLSRQLINDGKKIVEFVGKAYGLDEDLTEDCRKIILEKLADMALIADAKAFYNSVDPSENSDENALFEVKGGLLEDIYNLGYSPYNNTHSFDYTHYNVYEPHIRFYKIQTESAKGNVVATRQIGIMKMLGIGCEQNTSEAISRLFQCVFWGDIPSIYLLACCYDAENNDDKSRIFYDLAEICTKYLKNGVTVLPEEEKQNMSEEACTYYVYISTIMQDVILACNAQKIDFSFVEAITSDTLDYFQRMNYINNYDKKEWKNVTNTAVKPMRKIGF